MLTALYYFLQVILCSGIMMGYYWLVLRDKKFHQYNRFYLLMTAATAWIIPLIKIQWVPKPAAKASVYEFLTVIADGNARIDASLHNRWYQLSWQSGLTLLYVIVSTVFLIILLTGIMRVWRLVRTHKITSVGDFFLILTKTEGTPFSFFSYVFWNEAVDINSSTGKQMLQHEITHVQQKHSFDKLFIQVVMIAGWFNPFFWMIKAEMSMIHEYIADKKSVEQGDTAALAAMLLTAAYPQQQFLLSNPFFFSPIKRRIAMLTNQSNPKFSYLRRLVILPLLAVVVVLFAFRSKESLAKKPISLRTVIENLVDEVKGKEPLHTAVGFKLMPLQKKYTVVLNPGHGGEDPGAKALDGTTEAALVLEYAKLIKALNQNDQIEFVLTREEDITMSVGEVVNFVKNRNADLAISLHTNSVNASADIAKKISGTEIYILPQHVATDNQSYLLANSLGNNFRNTDINFKGIKSRKEGIQFLKNSTCPAVLAELGFLTNEEELKKLKGPAYQKNLATAILNGVQDYLYQKENAFSAVRDTTILNSDSVYVIPNGKEVKIIGNPTFVGPGFNAQPYFSGRKNTNLGISSWPNDALYILDGNIVDKKLLEDFDSNSIESVEVLKGKSAVTAYGEAGKNGVIIIRSKKLKVVQGYRTDESQVFASQANKPIFVVDGVIMDSLSLKEINPNDIDNMTILKDQKAVELFGEIARNGGVIDVKTKKYMLSKGLPLSSSKIKSDAPKLNSGDEYLQMVKSATAVILDGNRISKEMASKLDVRDIMSIGFGDFPIDKITKPNVLILQTKKGIRNSSSLYSVEELKRLDEMDAELKLKKDSNEFVKKFNQNLNGIKLINSNMVEQDHNAHSNMSEVMNAFYKRNPDIKKVSWTHDPLRMLVDLKNGSRETYDLTNPSRKALAEKRYGALPMPAPPPPPGPAPKSDIVVTGVKLEKVNGNFKAGEGSGSFEAAPVKGYKVTTKQVEASLTAKPEVPASFPGGKVAWQKYLDRNLNKDIIVEKGGPPGKYIVKVSFIVDPYGGISDIKALNDPGYGSSKEAVRMITKGPKWVPAQHKGKPVASRIVQTVTYVVSEE